MRISDWSSDVCSSDLVYDMLFDDGEDLRALPWAGRRTRLESFMPQLDPSRFDLSAILDAPDLKTLEQWRMGARDAAIEGLILKRRDSPYVAGRKTGLWDQWKREDRKRGGEGKSVDGTVESGCRRYIKKKN